MNPHHAYPDITWADLRAELLREIAHRRDFFAGRVSKGLMLQAEADREIDLFAAMAEDVERFRASRAPVAQGRPALPLPAPAHAYTWHDRRAAITRELDFRARFYPGWIAKGRTTTADAARQVRRLECLRALYEQGFDWRPANGARPAWASLAPTPEQVEARAEWLAIEAEVSARDGHTQEELAL